ncbi:endonuclease MutS2 [bacterium 1XD42-8]|jgi:DNA mismatch repair protein MutS2|nr:endonuclease MutS2 [Lachnospiraceae bacterium]RKJ52221.1 endonuclease MutS2 [bacterium 1XD42-8]
MDKKVLKILEYDKIIEQLEQKASSQGGKELCKNLLPMTDLSEILLAQTETKDALSRLFKYGHISFSGIKDITLSMKRLEIGASLSILELLHIASLLEAVSKVKAYSKKEKEEILDDSLVEMFHKLEPLNSILSEIRRCILSEDEISDNASSNLRQIRRTMKHVNEKIHSDLSKMVNGSLKNYLQDAVITMRNNRYCIPVKSEYKSQVQGMIHDQSSTGSTLFIEPSAIVKLNNDLKELSLKESQEIDAILASLSNITSEHIVDILENYQIMINLDFIFAKASLAMEQNASLPIFNEEGRIKLRQGRHPLLNKKTVVPIDVRLGDDFDLLVITGPNTGGKTVSLKTTGLLSLMGQAGLHIPALDRSELSVFHDIFADIGDEQSIEQSLSTFSSHMTKIISILNNANDRSLCLFDELGAGTDPTEGAALAISILSHLHNKGIPTMATTHYSELKVFALSTQGVENGCQEFNVETLKPTYRLLIGVPGKSNAFAISKKLGLPDYIISDAKSRINEQDISFEDLLTDLENNRITLEKEKEEVRIYKEEIVNLKKQLEKKQKTLEESKKKILWETKEKSRELLQEAKDYADEVIRNFQKYENSSPSMKQMEKERQKIREKIEKNNHPLISKQKTDVHKQLKPSDLHLGDAVKVLSLGVNGTVTSLPDNKGNLYVQCGILRSQVSLKDLILIDEPVITGPGVTKTTSSQMKISKSSYVSTEINLLGCTVDEALSRLDKYLDDAYLAHLTNVRIVHGKGTGALRNAIHGYLKRTKHVKSYRLGEFGEGDAGVTIVEFK